MAESRIKRWLPRSLQGRAVLILVLPVVTIQLVVSIVFIQRHYEGVTRQMTRNVTQELAFLHDRLSVADSRAQARAVAADLGAPLGFDIDLGAAGPTADARGPFDISGRTVAAELRAALPWIAAVDLAGSTRRVLLLAETPHGPATIGFDRRRVSASNPHQLLVLMLGTSLLMTLVAYLFLRNQLRPILRLAEVSEAFGRGRNVAFSPSGATEVRRAGHAFLAMRARIERQIEQRTLMLSGISHDLRTPLTRMRLALSMTDEGPERTLLEQDIAEMEALIAEFLAFAREDALDVPQDVALDAFLAGVVASAARAGRRVDFDAAPVTGRTVRLRPGAVARALDNLIGNAARHGTRCRLTATVGRSDVRLVVEDDGPGIPPDRQAEAVRAFATLDPARTRGRGAGAGLGLAIARDIARRHGGSLALGSSADLGGLRVELILAR
ncbi:MAG: ATP-binding protein [Rhodobacteraceae bacterium]|jgi:two-component system osmolarity sensor histidine kinase EnvZ|nr:ATP-binding protein [Paracoccaceae bacterium]